MSECYKCFYRSRKTLTCDYILITGEARKCSPVNCNKYKEKTGKNLEPYILDVQKLYYQNYSDRRIAKTLGISRYVVYTWRNINGLEANGESQRGRPKKE